MMLGRYEDQLSVEVVTEWTVILSPSRARIPDLTLVKAGGPQDRYLSHAPLLIVEMLSPEDTWPETRRKCEEYAAFGTGTMWIVDPARRTAEVWNDGEWRNTDVLTVAGTPIHIELAAVFARL